MARAVFLGLLALNLVLAGWYLAVDKRGQSGPGAVEKFQAPGLSLVDESSASIPRADLPGEDQNSAGSRRCLSLGPFTDDAEFEAAKLSLDALGLEGTKRRAQGQIWVGYWIFLPPPEKPEDAAGMVEALRERGVTDIYVEPAGERENAVSLGVFSERQRAQRRFREIRDLGFDPQIARRNRQGTVYWLDFIPDEEVRVDPGDFQVTPGRIVRLATRVCQ